MCTLLLTLWEGFSSGSELVQLTDCQKGHKSNTSILWILLDSDTAKPVYSTTFSTERRPPLLFMAMGCSGDTRIGI